MKCTDLSLNSNTIFAVHSFVSNNLKINKNSYKLYPSLKMFSNFRE